MTDEQTDVVIVGSGAGGGTLGWRLAKAGVRVTILEKGHWLTTKDFAYHDEILIQKRGFFAPTPDLEPHMVRRGDEKDYTRSRDGWIANCVGGGTVHMSGFFLRLHRVDLEMGSRVGKPSGSRVADWPIAYDELARWYDRVEYLLGVSGRAGENVFDEPRALPYPTPPIAEHPFTGPFDRAARKLGLHPFSTPRAVLSRPYAGRAPCNHCGYCGNFGCEIGAKSSVLAALIPDAIATGKLTVLPDCMATEITTDEAGQATGVRYLDSSGQLHQQRARVVVVSCSSIESARLLLMSRERAPEGVANGNGLVGKNLSFSTYSGAEARFQRTGALADEPVWTSTLPFLGRSLQDFYLPRDKRAPLPKGGTLRFDMMPKPPIYNATQVATREGQRVLWGARLKDALRDHFHGSRSLECETFHEFHPNDRTYVSLDPEVKDRFGLPAARVDVSLLPEDVAMSRWLADRAAEIFRAMGADSVEIPQWGRATWVLQHGTCRMGKDPSTSVLDPSCRSHQVPNLYVVDGSFMPSSGGVPTTLTIMANALRVAETMRARFVAREH